MKPKNIKTKIFLDSASATDTDVVLYLFGFLDGQTTNPTLLAKHHDLKYLWPLTTEAVWDFYKSEAKRIAHIIPNKPISIEVYADEESTAEDITNQALQISTWFDDCYVKLPITKAGLTSASELIAKGVKLNLTLCFSQEQALAVHLATHGAKKNQVYISPFIGRLEGEGYFGLDLIKNIRQMYQELNSHVQIISASIRNVEQLAGAVYLESDAITASRVVLEEWKKTDYIIKKVENTNLKPIEYQKLDYKIKDWTKLNISHQLTEAGLKRFVTDWKLLTK